jgi:hypothetical protein
MQRFRTTYAGPAQIPRSRHFTWFGLEPTLDIESSLAVVNATCDFVDDLYKVDRVDYLPMT